MLAVLLAVHFVLIQVANMPLSPMQLALNGPISHYVNPYFTQRWNFFSPNPPDDGTLLIVRGTYRLEGQSQLITGWVDASTPFYNAVASNRLTPVFLVELGMSNALSSLMGVLSKNPAKVFGPSGTVPSKDPLPIALDPFDLAYLTRHGAVTLNLAFPNLKFDSIQVAVLKTHYPPFPERFNAEWKDSHPGIILFDWQTFPSVQPFHQLHTIR
jgi:hypothetical protein